MFRDALEKLQCSGSRRSRRARGRKQRRFLTEQLEQRNLLAGDLELSLSVAPNFVVDSNVQTPAGKSPTAAYLMVDVTNSGTDPLEDVFVYFGDHFDGGGNDSPGLTSKIDSIPSAICSLTSGCDD